MPRANAVLLPHAARDLHDELGSLALLAHALRRAGAEVGRGHATEAARGLAEAERVLAGAIAGLRRVLLDLRPPALEERSFAAALRLLARQFALGSGMTIRVRIGRDAAALPRPHQVALFRVLQGALANVLRHAHARHAVVAVRVGAGAVVMTIEDDGAGFAATRPGPGPRGIGLAVMAERARELGGEVRVRSWPVRRQRHGRGTRVEVSLPLPSRGSRR
jgi:signal transduction histidine kinase